MQQRLYVMSLMITRRDIDLNKYLGKIPSYAPFNKTGHSFFIRKSFIKISMRVMWTPMRDGV